MAFYLDTDVVVIANLNHLLSTGDGLLASVEKEPLWVWGQKCSGFMGINTLRFEEFWHAVGHCETVRQDPWPKKNDQWLLGLVSKCFDYLAAELPDPSPWSVHIGSGYRGTPHRLNRRAGMLHLQNPDVNKWFEDRKKPCGNSTPGKGDGTCFEEDYVDKFCHRAGPFSRP